MKNLHTPTNQPSPFYPDTGKDRRSPLGLTKFVDVSGIEPEALAYYACGLDISPC
tara:strand:- start:1146 stop:1310 length:165 start_codon:yes stop_codon:yes gene_type:complete